MFYVGKTTYEAATAKQSKGFLGGLLLIASVIFGLWLIALAITQFVFAVMALSQGVPTMGSDPIAQWLVIWGSVTIGSYLSMWKIPHDEGNETIYSATPLSILGDLCAIASLGILVWGAVILNNGSLSTGGLYDFMHLLVYFMLFGSVVVLSPPFLFAAAGICITCCCPQVMWW